MSLNSKIVNLSKDIYYRFEHFGNDFCIKCDSKHYFHFKGILGKGKAKYTLSKCIKCGDLSIQDYNTGKLINSNSIHFFELLEKFYSTEFINILSDSDLKNLSDEQKKLLEINGIYKG